MPTADPLSPAPRPPASPPAPLITRLLTSWKLWIPALLLAVAGIALVLLQPIVARKRAIEYFQQLAHDQPNVLFVLAEGAEEWTESYGEWGAGFQEVESLEMFHVNDEILAHAGALRDISRLRLGESKQQPAVTERGCAALRGMCNLKDLDLSGPGFSDEGIAGILACRPPLREVRLRTPAGRETIRSLSRIPSIEHLEIPEGEFDDDAFRSLDPLRRLKGVTLSGVGDQGAAWLAQSPELTSLTLFSSTLTDAGLQRLAELP